MFFTILLAIIITIGTTPLGCASPEPAPEIDYGLAWAEGSQSEKATTKSFHELIDQGDLDGIYEKLCIHELTSDLQKESEYAKKRYYAEKKAYETVKKSEKDIADEVIISYKTERDTAFAIWKAIEKAKKSHL